MTSINSSSMKPKESCLERKIRLDFVLSKVSWQYLGREFAISNYNFLSHHSETRAGSNEHLEMNLLPHS